MKTTIIFGLCLFTAFLTCQSAVLAGSYEKLLATIHDLPIPESDGTQLPFTFKDGKKRTYTRGILDDIVDTIVGAYKSVVDALGFEVSYKTASGTEVEMRGVIMNKGTDQEELVVVGGYSYSVGGTAVSNMYTAGKDGVKSHFIIKNRETITLKEIESLLGG